MRNAPFIPLAPAQYDQRVFNDIFNALRTYFFYLDNIDVLRTGRLLLTAPATDATAVDTEVWLASDGSLRIAGPNTAPTVSAPLFYEGKPTASQLRQWVAAHAFTFPSGLTGSVAKAGTAATAQKDFDLKKNGTSFGTMRFAASATAATFIAASATAFAIGDVLTVTAPGSQDSTLANIAVNLVGFRS